VRLSDALRVQAGSALAFTGAGGKTAALRRLSEEATQDFPVLLSTSTHLGLNQADMAGAHVVLAEDPNWEELRAELLSHKSVLATGPQIENEPRWGSPGDSALAGLNRLAEECGALLAVEADGSRGHPIKAPADHEPLVPNFTNLLVPTVGASAFRQPLTSDVAHRSDLVSRLLGVPQGERLSPELVARLVSSPEGGLKGRPLGAAVRVLMNQVDDADREEAALACGRLLLEAEAIEAVILGSLAGAQPVRRVLGRTAGVVLAAGGSQRLGRPKLLELWKGEPLVRHVVRGAMESGLAPIAVVLGDHAEELRSAISGLPVMAVENADWSSGQSSSMRLGLATVGSGSEAVVFLLGDMPLVQPELVRALVRAHESSLVPIVAPKAEGRRGNPVLFDRVTFGALGEVQGDQGGRALFERFEIISVEADGRQFFDLDTEDDLRWLRGQP
jgi:molybdenum cofactor cytidylyltransferase